MDDLLKAISAAPKAIAELETKSLVIKRQIGEVREAIEGIKVHLGRGRQSER